MSNSEAWVENPDQFIPERWSRRQSCDQSVVTNQIHPFVSLPFGFGPRMCIGRRLASMEVFTNKQCWNTKLFLMFKGECFVVSDDFEVQGDLDWTKHETEDKHCGSS